MIGSIRETLFAGAGRAALVDRFADPRIAIVTATVTEKGYCHDPATGALNLAHPDIVHDLAHPDAPESAVGILVAGLASRRAGRRRAAHVRLLRQPAAQRAHGGRTRDGIRLRERDAALAEWIRANVAFPCSMVDRIVPATTDADFAEAERLLGVRDAAPVAAEAFGQWVIEDRFAGPRPAWEDAGAQFVADVAPFETMKLRLLNGSHSTLAYLGFLMGHDYIWQASADPLLASLAERQMADEIAPTLARPAGIDLATYCAQLMQRFRNSALAAPDATDRDGRLAEVAATPARHGARPDRDGAPPTRTWRWRSPDGSATRAAPTSRDGAIEVADPLAATFAQIVRDARGDPGAIADGFLDLKPVFGADLVAHYAFREAVRGDVIALFRDGARATLARHLGVA